MSQLFVATSTANWQLNITSFSSPLQGEIQSAQVKKMALHFPIKVNQPQIQFGVQFESENQYENFQKFVRDHQQDALANANLVWLNWPERNINNWTGVIKKFQAGGKRFNFAPRGSFVVDLVDSLVSNRTFLSAIPSTLWQTIYGSGMGPNAVLTQPTLAQDQAFVAATSGQTQGQFTVNPTGPNSAPLPNPSQPGFGPTGITAGS